MVSPTEIISLSETIWASHRPRSSHLKLFSGKGLREPRIIGGPHEPGAPGPLGPPGRPMLGSLRGPLGGPMDPQGPKGSPWDPNRTLWDPMGHPNNPNGMAPHLGTPGDPSPIQMVGGFLHHRRVEVVKNKICESKLKLVSLHHFAYPLPHGCDARKTQKNFFPFL